ncbi:MAG: hypothetical protein RL120_14875 [Gammaproteobacteria bacterium]
MSKSRFMRDVSVAILLLGCLIALPAYGQDAVQRGVAGGSLGTVERLSQDEGYITISGRNWGYAEGITQIFLQDEQVPATMLERGMSVRFTVNAQGTILQMRILGPFNQLRLRDQN